MMNAPGHLPAGQGMQGGNVNVAMAGSGGAGGGAGHNNGGTPRRGGGRPNHNNQHHQNHYNHQMHQQQYLPQMPQQPPFYSQYNPYVPPYYQVQHQQYPNGNSMVAQGYNMMGHMGYPPVLNGYSSRSPPPMPQQYLPMAPQPQQPYAGPPHHSPIMTGPPYQAPPPLPIATPHYNPQAEAFVGPSTLKSPMPVMDQGHLPHQPVMPLASPPQEHVLAPVSAIAQMKSNTPVEVQHQGQTPTLPRTPTSAPAPVQPPASVSGQSISEDTEKPKPADESSMPPTTFFAFRPSLPWLSRPEEPFPKMAPKSRRRRRMLEAGGESVELPLIHQNTQEAVDELPTKPTERVHTETGPLDTPTPRGSPLPKVNGHEQASTRSETPSAHDAPSEIEPSTAPTTPGSGQPPLLSTSTTNTAPSATAKPTAPRAAVPAIPVVPVLPKPTTKDTKAELSKDGETKTGAAETATDIPAATVVVTSPVQANGSGPLQGGEQPVAGPAPSPVDKKPVSWAALLHKGSPAAAASKGTGPKETNGTASGGAGPSSNGSSTSTNPIKASLGEALQAYRVGKPDKISFIEPRGLINNGNMCYMNSVLQVLLHCIPFYDFLDQVGNKAAFSFKGDTPLIHAMINFQKEFNVIDSASSAEALRKRLKPEQLERYGEQFIPKFVYDAIRKLKRFDTMQRGQQQDADEFLSYLLEGMAEECAKVMQDTTSACSVPTPTSSVSSEANGAGESGDDWLEVGPRQRAAVTRSSGHSTASPITKIFAGLTRSEYKVPGQKPSITHEPFQQFPLDISASDIHNLVDALKNSTRPETLHGDSGLNAKSVKTTLIETLPNVLVFQLKRFHFDSSRDRTVKIWKQIGYPLELDIPLECISRQTRNLMTAEGSGAPRYRLVSVVYHHGNEASGGHYTVDVRRQDGQEWIRIDDTIIRRVRSEDVAAAGAEEKAVKMSTSDSRRDASTGPVANRFGAIDDEDAGDDEGGWNKVSPANGNKKYSAAANSAATPSPVAKTAKHLRGNLSDNKVAYLLFYEKI